MKNIFVKKSTSLSRIIAGMTVFAQLVLIGNALPLAAYAESAVDSTTETEVVASTEAVVDTTSSTEETTVVVSNPDESTSSSDAASTDATVTEDTSTSDTADSSEVVDTETPEVTSSDTTSADSQAPPSGELPQEVLAPAPVVTGTPTLTTDKDDYLPEEIAHIVGSFFGSLQNIVLKIFAGDVGNDYTEANVPVTANESGTFEYDYTLDNVYRPLYTVIASDTNGSTLAQMTFKDNVGYNKGIYKKGAVSPNNDTLGNWTTGNAGSNYQEGHWIFYEYQATGLTNTVPDFDIYYDEYPGTGLFIDALNNFRACVDTLCESVNASGPAKGMLIDGVSNPPSTTAGGWVDAVSATSNHNRPYINNVCTSTPDPVNSPSAEHCFHVDGPTLKALLIASPNVPDNIFDSGTHSVTFYVEAHLAKSNVWSAGKAYLLGCSSSSAYATPGSWAVSGGPYGTDAYNQEADPCSSGPTAWTGTSIGGAGLVSGSSGHFNLNPVVGSNGAITLPIPTVPQPSGSITIVKVTNPASATGVIFPFTGDLGAFNLDTDVGTAGTPNTVTFSNLSGGGAYNITESAVANWNLTNLVCVNNTGASTFAINGSTATVNLANTSGASVTCTYTNTLQQGKIELQKDFVGTPENVTIKIGTSQNGTQVDSDVLSADGTDGEHTVTPGNYFVSETLTTPANYTSSLACFNDINDNDAIDGGDTVHTVNTSTGEVAVASNDDVICRYTNTRNTGTVIVKKVMVGGTDTFNYTGTPNGAISVNNGTIQATVDTGAYNSVEGAKAGWDLTSIVCDDANSTGNVGNRTASFNVEKDEVVTCTFTNTKRGTVIINKVTVGGNDTFSYTGTGSEISANFGILTVGGTGSITFNNVIPGTKTVTETSPTSPWSFTNLVCSDPDNGSSVNTTTRVATIDVDAGETVTCTYTNTKLPTLTVNKVTVPANDDGKFNLQIDGNTAGTGANVGNGGTTGAQIVTVGAHTAGEIAGIATDLDNYTAVISGDCAPDGSVSLAAGENKVCTITNTRKGTIIVEKQTLPDGSNASFTFTGDAGGIISDGGKITVSKVLPGAYGSTESAKAGWDLTSIVCDDLNSTGDVQNRIANFNVEAGETVKCTFTNTQRGHIILEKQTIPDGSQEVFDFDMSFGDGDADLADGQTDDTEVMPGTYSASENVPAGWDLTSAVCSDQSPVGAISVQPGETVTCVFTNTQRGHIIVQKVTVGGDASFEFDSNYGANFFLMNGQSNDSGAIVPGAYSVDEVNIPAGWAKTNATCSDGSPIGAISLQAGETVTCTFTNNKPAAQIDLTPLTDTNKVGDQHTFNVNVQVHNGNGVWGPASDGTNVTFTITNSLGATATFVGANNCNTVAGVCSVIINSPTAGHVVVKASATPVVLGVNLPVSTGTGGDNSADAQKDYVNARISIGTTDTNEVNDDHTFTVLVEQSVQNGVWTPVQGAIVDAIPSPLPGTFDESDCTAGTDVNGLCDVVLNSAVAGVFNVSASTSINVNGVAFNLLTDGQNGNSQPAVKTYVDASIALTPQTAVNKIGDPHTIYVHVTKNDGSGVSDAVGVTVVFSVTSGSATFVGNDNDCVTNGAGVCSVQIVSNTTGNNVINATTTFSVGGVSLTRATNGNSGPLGSDSAEKDYVKANISIASSATNKVGDQHVFTVTVTKDTGSGVEGIAGINPVVSFTPGAPGTVTDNCNLTGTNASGQCTVVINSTVAGIYTASATVNVIVNTVPFVLTTNGQNGNSGTATKTYVDAKIVLSPLTATNNITDPHTIIATVTQNIGGVESPAPDGTLVTFSLTNNAGATATFVGSNSCTITNGLGSCSVVINSPTPGNVDIHATTTFLVGGVSLTRATDGTHGSSGDANKVYVAGALDITKALNVSAYAPLPLTNVDGTFTVVVTGPSYPGGHNVEFTMVDGVITSTNPVHLEPLIPGNYTVTENDPGIAWDVTGAGGVTVVANQTAQKTITNTIKDPHTTISITSNTQETAPGENVILTIADKNDGTVPLTNPTVTFTYDAVNEILGTAPTAHCTAATESGTVNGIMDVGETWTWTCTVMIGVNTTFNVAGHGFDPFGTDVTPDNGVSTEAGNITVRVIGTTRTLGFWQTHTNFTTMVWNTYVAPTNNNFIGEYVAVVQGTTHKGILTTMNQVFGGFYAPIAKTTLGAKRTPVDQARIQMLQQLLAAKLNCAAFGCSASIQTLITQADNAFGAGTDKNLIISLAGQLDAFNNSGDANAIPPSLGATGKATPAQSQSLADKVFWNLP